MTAISKGRYRARLAETAADIDRAQALRWTAFRAARGLAGAGAGTGVGGPEGRDSDRFDDRCRHVLVEEIASGRLVCCFRLLPLPGGADIGQSYAAQFYDLTALRGFAGPMVEMGRFCLDPAVHDPDILRLAWGVMARFVDEARIEMLFGCSSFMGTDAESYRDAFAMLRERHLAPRRWLPKVKAPRVFRFARRLAQTRPDMHRAMAAMPPLLRSYLLMGGWVSDHAVVDRDLDTLHVFTGLEIRAIPPARAAAMRAVAG